MLRVSEVSLHREAFPCTQEDVEPVFVWLFFLCVFFCCGCSPGPVWNQCFLFFYRCLFAAGPLRDLFGTRVLFFVVGACLLWVLSGTCLEPGFCLVFVVGVFVAVGAFRDLFGTRFLSCLCCGCFCCCGCSPGPVWNQCVCVCVCVGGVCVCVFFAVCVCVWVVCVCVCFCGVCVCVFFCSGCSLGPVWNPFFLFVVGVFLLWLLSGTCLEPVFLFCCGCSAGGGQRVMSLRCKNTTLTKRTSTPNIRKQNVPSG